MNAFQIFVLHVFNIFYPIKIFGAENIPDGSALLLCNHFRAIDCGFVARACPKDVYFLAKKELFGNKIAGKVIASFGGIPIDRDNPEISSILQAVKVLKNGKRLVVFPEGTRNKHGDTLQKIKSGSGIFAVKGKCPIVPMMLLKKSRFLRRTYLIIGKPFQLSDYYGKKLSQDEIAEMDVIISQKMREEHETLKTIVLKGTPAKGNSDKCKS